ncbi:probable pectinesterase/pectinesterase inhibitor 6 [Argentina anserina]|uniref:probable pectinesterase/pectinesterase inhibitor 6 n=1 Tax=Argentina anserina TaxID=57926 RepID=UPI0021766CEE|nr:probable pectinesterase/pectinesterase inhibitor 6 [Potentilla anserina]
MSLFLSSLLAVNAQGFIAIDIWFANTAGQKMGQAVAILSGGDRAVFYRCRIRGNQDTFLVQAGRQFFRECQILGTIDFIFGYGTAVFQKCNIYIRKNLVGGTNVIAAQGRGSPTSSHTSVGIGTLVPGQCAALRGRVKWPGYHKLSALQAYKFTVAKFIDGNSWLPSIGKRWSILRTTSFFDIRTQVRIINACCVLYNFIRIEKHNDPLLEAEEFHILDLVDRELAMRPIEINEEEFKTIKATNEWIAFRDRQAMDMFVDYRRYRVQQVHQEQREVENMP